MMKRRDEDLPAESFRIRDREKRRSREAESTLRQTDWWKWRRESGENEGGSTSDVGQGEIGGRSLRVSRAWCTGPSRELDGKHTAVRRPGRTCLHQSKEPGSGRAQASPAGRERRWA